MERGNDKEKPGQDAEVFVKAVKRKTRKYFGAEEKIRIVLEGMKRDVSVAELNKIRSPFGDISST